MGVPCLMFWAHVLPRLTPAIRRSVRRSKPRQAVRGARRPYSPPRKILRGQPITSSTISHTSAQKQELAILDHREHKAYNTCAAKHFSVTIHCASFNHYINITHHNIYSISNVSYESIDKIHFYEILFHFHDMFVFVQYIQHSLGVLIYSLYVV